MADDEIKAIKEFDKANQKGFDEAMSSGKESEKAREKSADRTSEQIKGDGGSAKDPLDSAGLSDEAKEEKGAK